MPPMKLAGVQSRHLILQVQQKNTAITMNSQGSFPEDASQTQM